MSRSPDDCQADLTVNVAGAKQRAAALAQVGAVIEAARRKAKEAKR